MSTLRRAGLVAATAAAVPLAAAYRFALVYRRRAGYPRRVTSEVTPADLGMPFETLSVSSAGAELPAWFIPAEGGRRGPAVVIVHGWESARYRSLPMARFLHAAGFHALLIDVRGHGANPPEPAPITGAEFGADAAAAVRQLASRDGVSAVGVVGHSMGGIGALLAAASEPLVAATIAISTPADPYRLTRLTFQLAELPLPDPIAYPLAWLTARVYARPRGHRIADVSASKAIARVACPILLIHGAQDPIVPLDHLERLTRLSGGRAETYIVPTGAHSWLYEDPGFRAAVATFLTRALGGPLTAEEAARRAVAVDARRIPEPDEMRGIQAVEEAPAPGRLAAEIAGVRRWDGRDRDVP